MRKYSLALLLITVCLSAAADTKHAIDSLKALIPAAQGEAKLQLLLHVSELYTSTNEPDAHEKVLRAYLAESDRQESAKHSCLARTSMVIFWYNSLDYRDSIDFHLSDYMSFVAQREDWTSYYTMLRAHLLILIFTNRFEEALTETSKMHNFAQQHHHIDGLALTTYLMGLLYNNMERFSECIVQYKESAVWHKKCEDYASLSEVYDGLALAYLQTGDMGQAKIMAREALGAVDQAVEYNRKQGEPYDPSDAYFRRYITVVVVNTVSGDTAEAGHYIRKAESMGLSSDLVSGYALRQAQARYYLLVGKYAALSAATDLYTQATTYADSTAIVEALGCKASALYGLHRYKEAYDALQQHFSINEIFTTRNLTRQLDELNSLYHVDKYKWESATKSRQMLFLAVVVGLLAAVVAILIYYHIQLRRKNRALYKQICQEQDAQASHIAAHPSSSEPPSQKDELFDQVLRLLQMQDVYGNPELGREEIAALLGTNAKYVSDSIRENSGGRTVREFLNLYRLDLSCKMLREHPSNASIEDIFVNCGFSSRSTYYRLFSAHYGLSPMEFRRMAEEGIVEKGLRE